MKKDTTTTEVDVKEDNPKPKKVKMFYGPRDVIKQNYRDKIDEEINLKPNEYGYIRGYQKAVTTILEQLDDDEKEEVQRLVDLWNTEGGPSDVQLK